MACPTGICAALADPSKNAKIIKCHISVNPENISPARKTVYPRFKPNIIAITFLLSKRSAKYPVKGGIKTLGIMARNVTSPTYSDDSDISHTIQPRVTIRAQDAAPAQMFAVQSTL